MAFVVAGSDVTVSFASEAGQMQLNAFEPVMMHVLMQNSTWLRRAMRTLRVNCVDGITANEEFTEGQVAASVGVSTALNPHIGYAAASRIAKTALKTGQRVADMVVEEGLLDAARVEELLKPEALAGKFPETSAIGNLSKEEIAELERKIDSLDPKELGSPLD